MSYNLELHHRRSIRLKGFDYASAGAFFGTVFVQNRECLFGEIRDYKMHLNDAGQMVLQVWNDLPRQYQGVNVDAFMLMPNH
ncbi:hypothetical protein OFB92_33025, partial [Escherichia coli]|nr:hypothetical protein [Escherichia coli]